MATNYDLKLVVDADTSEAQRKLDALGGGASAPGGGSGAPGAPSPTPAAHEAAERVRQARNGLGGGSSGGGTSAPGGGSGAPGAPSPTPAAHEAAERVRQARNGLGGGSSGGGGRQPQEFGRAAGDVAGKMIGKAVAGFMAHEVASVVFNGLKTPGGDNSTVNRAEAAVGGAMRYGTMGAMLGGPLGAIIGSLAGAGMGLFQELIRQKKAVEARDQAIRVSDYSRTRDTAAAASDSAFGQSLELAGGWRQRQEMIRARRNEIENGSGTWSIKNLKEELKGLNPESGRGQVVAANLEMQKSRVAQLDRQLVDEGLAVAPGRLEPGSVTDSLAKRGIQVGAQVDVAQVNEKIMGEVQSCRSLLEKIANMGTDNLHNIGAMQRAVYE